MRSWLPCQDHGMILDMVGPRIMDESWMEIHEWSTWVICLTLYLVYIIMFMTSENINFSNYFSFSSSRVYLIHAVEDEDYYGGNDCMVMQDLDVGYDKGGFKFRPFFFVSYLHGCFLKKPHRNVSFQE